MMAEKLTPKQAQFVIEYLVDLNATQAAIRAGYSEDTAGAIGAENLKKPQILEAINEQLDARAQRTLITADFVLHGMREVYLRCMQKEPVMIFDKVEKEYVQETVMVQNEGDAKPHEEGVWKFDSVGANKALENMAKHLKLLTDKLELGNPDGTNMKFPEMQTVFVAAVDPANKKAE